MSSNIHRAQLPGTGETRQHPAEASPRAGHRAAGEGQGALLRMWCPWGSGPLTLLRP